MRMLTRAVFYSLTPFQRHGRSRVYPSRMKNTPSDRRPKAPSLLICDLDRMRNSSRIWDAESRWRRPT
jgi:hypothetical protein